MQAAVVRQPSGAFRTEEVEIAEPIGGEVLVRVCASGLCRTDVMMQALASEPSVFGHEVAGVVEAVGPLAGSVAVGDHVVACPVLSCGRCRHCLEGNLVQCLDPNTLLRTPNQTPRLSTGGRPVLQGFGIGGFAQSALIHERQLAVVPKDVPFAQAAIIGCSVATGAGAVFNTARLRQGSSVVVVGVGGIGLNTIAAARASGAMPIVAVDIADDKLELARRFGATVAINSTTSDAVAKVLESTDGGADAVFDCVAHGPVIDQTPRMLGPGGTLYIIGAEPGAHYNIDTLDFIRLQKKVQGSRMGSSVPQRDIPRYAKLYLEGRWDLDALVSSTIGLDEIDNGYTELSRGGIARVVITEL